MEKLVWPKVKQFLEELRCEDIDRESKVETYEFQTAKRNLHEKRSVSTICNRYAERRTGKNQGLCGSIKGIFF